MGPETPAPPPESFLALKMPCPRCGKTLWRKLKRYGLAGAGRNRA
jgi:hypothetical protein